MNNEFSPIIQVIKVQFVKWKHSVALSQIIKSKRKSQFLLSLIYSYNIEDSVRLEFKSIFKRETRSS